MPCFDCAATMAICVIRSLAEHFVLYFTLESRKIKFIITKNGTIRQRAVRKSEGEERQRERESDGWSGDKVYLIRFWTKCDHFSANFRHRNSEWYYENGKPLWIEERAWYNFCNVIHKSKDKRSMDTGNTHTQKTWKLNVLKLIIASKMDNILLGT